MDGQFASCIVKEIVPGSDWVVVYFPNFPALACEPKEIERKVLNNNDGWERVEAAAVDCCLTLYVPASELFDAAMVNIGCSYNGDKNRILFPSELPGNKCVAKWRGDSKRYYGTVVPAPSRGKNVSVVIFDDGDVSWVANEDIEYNECVQHVCGDVCKNDGKKSKRQDFWSGRDHGANDDELLIGRASKRNAKAIMAALNGCAQMA